MACTERWGDSVVVGQTKKSHKDDIVEKVNSGKNLDICDVNYYAKTYHDTSMWGGEGALGAGSSQDEIQNHMYKRVTAWVDGGRQSGPEADIVLAYYRGVILNEGHKYGTAFSQEHLNALNESSNTNKATRAEFADMVASDIDQEKNNWGYSSGPEISNHNRAMDGWLSDGALVDLALDYSTLSNNPEASNVLTNWAETLFANIPGMTGKDKGDFEEWKLANPVSYEKHFKRSDPVSGVGFQGTSNIKINPDDDDPINFKSTIDKYYRKYGSNLTKKKGDNGQVATEKEILQEQVDNAVDELLDQVCYWYSNVYRAHLVLKIISTDDPGQDLTDSDVANAEEGAAAQAGEAGVGTPEPADQPLKAEDIKERQKFFKQCALLAILKDLSKDYQDYIKDECKRLAKKPIVSPGQTPTKKNADPDSDVHFGGLPFGGRFWMVGSGDGDNSSIINKLFACKQMDAFLNITPDVAAMLVPKIRIYKIFNTTESVNSVEQVEFDFSQRTDWQRIEDLPYTPFDRGDAAGIKDFAISYEGSSPATAKNDISAKMTLFLQSFQDFFKVRESASSFTSEGDPRTYRYVDMILYPGAADEKNETANKNKKGYGKASTQQYDPSYYRIRADVGWTIPDDPLIMSELRKRGKNYPEELITALKLTNKTLFLNMVDHDIDIRNDGTVLVNVHYRAYIESALKTSRFDALTSRSIVKERIDNEQKINAALVNCSDEQLKELQATFNQKEEELIKSSHQSILKRLLERKKVFFLDLEDESADQFRKTGYFTSKPKLIKPVTNAPPPTGNAGAATVAAPAAPKDSGLTDDAKYSFVSNRFYDQDIVKGTRINYFFMGDLMHVILDSCFHEVDNSPEIENTKFLFTDFELLDWWSPNDFTLNIADIPISVEYFFEWFVDNVISSERKKFPVIHFIRQLCNELIVSMLAETCQPPTSAEIKKLQFNTAVFTGVGKDKKDPFSDMVSPKSIKVNASTEFNKSPDPGLPLAADKGIEGTHISDFYNYMIIYPSYNTYRAVGLGIEEQDLNRGVYHLHIGGRAGLVKNIKFTKTDMQYIREARFINQGKDGLMQLGAVYKVTVEMIGNTIFYPGMEVYIDPMGIGGLDWNPTSKNSIANKLGFGGYHMVTRVNSSLGPGKFTTTLEAQWHYPGDGSEYKTNLNGDKEEASKDISKKPKTSAQAFNCRYAIASEQYMTDQLKQGKSIEEAEKALGTKQVEWASARAEEIEYEKRLAECQGNNSLTGCDDFLKKHKAKGTK